MANPSGPLTGPLTSTLPPRPPAPTNKTAQTGSLAAPTGVGDASPVPSQKLGTDGVMTGGKPGAPDSGGSPVAVEAVSLDDIAVPAPELKREDTAMGQAEESVKGVKDGALGTKDAADKLIENAENVKEVKLAKADLQAKQKLPATDVPSGDLDAAKHAVKEAEGKMRGQFQAESPAAPAPGKASQSLQGAGAGLNVLTGGLSIRDGSAKVGDGFKDLTAEGGDKVGGGLKVLAGSADVASGAAGIVDGTTAGVQFVARTSSMASKLAPIGNIAGRVAVPIAGVANIAGGALDIHDGIKTLNDPKATDADKGAAKEKICVGSAKSIGGTMMVAGAAASATGIGAVAGVPLVVAGSVITAGAAIYENRQAIINAGANAGKAIGHAAVDAGKAVGNAAKESWNWVKSWW